MLNIFLMLLYILVIKISLFRDTSLNISFLSTDSLSIKTYFYIFPYHLTLSLFFITHNPSLDFSLKFPLSLTLTIFLQTSHPFYPSLSFPSIQPTLQYSPTPTTILYHSSPSFFSSLHRLPSLPSLCQSHQFWHHPYVFGLFSHTFEANKH